MKVYWYKFFQNPTQASLNAKGIEVKETWDRSENFVGSEIYKTKKDQYGIIFMFK